ncbi:putative transporter of the NRAMP family [Pluteus cervinus]|uniref:Transporter of the NRAMP family n=1 Tax=Pluteus cervinus TaxID=181527 RepID=A0ACD3AK76_9AGAR|nr:putative transporter of the NRAMP family [Pluteus cervinus]
MSLPNPSGTPSISISSSQCSLSDRIKSVGYSVYHHARKHTGVGIVCAVAYFDPGNWGVDLQAGSEFGYRLLFVVLLAGLFAVFLQVLASRLGCVTGVDLATHSRLLLYNRPNHTKFYRWLGLYPLYILAEIAIIATDLAELLGSAIALCMLFPRLQLWHGVLLTAFDVIFILALGDPLRGKPVRTFELLIAGLVLAVLICMAVIIAKVDVDWASAFGGFIPSKYIFRSGGLYTSVGILGATVMPHSLFLGSALATQDRVSWLDSAAMTGLPDTLSKSSVQLTASSASFLPGRWLHDVAQAFIKQFCAPPPSEYSTSATRHSDRENRPLGFVKAHIYHGIVDIVLSLLGFAVIINSMILILASAVFHHSSGNTGGPASLFDTYDLIRELVGKPAATLFAVALLSAGQSSSIIATVAGQAVSEGFLQWRLSPVVRRLLTRLLAIIPSVAVALAVGRDGIDTLLVASQVVLSMALPFITFPLLWCTASRTIMRVKIPIEAQVYDSVSANPIRIEDPTEQYVDYSNSKLTIFVGVLIWLMVVAANVYVIVELALDT